MKSQNLSVVLISMLLLGFFLFATSVEGKPGQVGLKVVFNDSYTEVTPGFEGVASLTVTHITTGTTVSKLDFSVLLKAETAVQGAFTASFEVKLNDVIKNTFEVNQQVALNANEGVKIPVGTLTALDIESYAQANVNSEYDLELKVTDCRVGDTFFNGQSMIIPLQIDTTVSGDDPTGGGGDVVVDDPVENPDPVPSSVIFSNGFEEGSFTEWTSTTTSGAGSTISVQSTTTYQGSYALNAYTEATGGAAYAYYGLNEPELYARCYFRVDALTNDQYFTPMRFVDASGNIVAMARMDGDQTIIYTKNGGTPVFDYGVYDIAVDTWYCLELHWFYHATAGEATLWINGLEVGSITGIDTTSSGYAKAVRVGETYAFDATNRNTFVDNVVISTERVGS